MTWGVGLIVIEFRVQALRIWLLGLAIGDLQIWGLGRSRKGPSMLEPQTLNPKHTGLGSGLLGVWFQNRHSGPAGPQPSSPHPKSGTILAYGFRV